MANVVVEASLMLNTGEVVDLQTTMSEGTETELLTSTKYAVSAVSLGQFADGKVITQILQPPSAPNGIAYAYIERRGEILCILPVAKAGVQDEAKMPLNRKPLKPNKIHYFQKFIREQQVTWKPYLFMESF